MKEPASSISFHSLSVSLFGTHIAHLDRPTVALLLGKRMKGRTSTLSYEVYYDTANVILLSSRINYNNECFFFLCVCRPRSETAVKSQDGQRFLPFELFNGSRWNDCSWSLAAFGVLKSLSQ